ncbi:trichohyalin isoform X3 [Lampris incognitus]|uniref:trichohyalin isoform X3 n=1 Tax=Lampris incognitus TaxID=2546036 RepID=UPI0024B618BA|nr:trichohyalin isoform X3 [Lampris incognitus]
MGTKRPGWTLLNKLHIQNADRRQISRETSPRPGAVAQSERDRERNQEEEQRRERETERVRDKQRNVANNKDPRKTYSDRGRGPAPRDKAGEREWREVERRQEMERGKNVRPVSHLEKGTETEADRGRKKGDTFPRMTRGGKEREGRMAPFVESEEGRGGKKPMDRQMRIEMDDGERERERAWIRERQGDREKHSEREREVFRSRPKKEGERNSSRPMEDGTMQQKGRRREPDPEFRERRRERVVEITDQGVRRERDNPRERDRERERPRPGLAEREGRMPSPRRRREKEAYSDREDGEKMGREARKRDTRSEGDCDGRIQVERLRERRRERGELRHHHSRSEGDAKERMVREREQERWGVEERPRHREKDREREADRLREKGGEKEREMYRERDRRKEKERRPDVERWMDGTRDNKGCREEVRHRPGDRREEEDRYREREEEGGRRRERKEGETDRRWEDAAGCVRQSPSEVLRAQSSGEWSSDVDSERRCRRGGGDSYDERESSRESTAESERETEEEKRCRGDNGRGERSNPDRREEREQRRMWLEPQRGKYSKDSSLEDEVTERERHTTRRKERKRGDERRTESGTGDWEEGGRGECEERDKTYVNRGDAGRGGHSESGRHGRRGETEAERGRETEGVGVDREEASMAQRRRDDGRREHLSDSDRGAEGSHLKDREKEKVTDNAEESGRQEEAGSDHCGCSESEGGSDPGWEQEKDRMWSGEDGFVTVSSSGDDEDEREEEEFVDCREFWEGGMPHDSDQPVSYKGCEEERERHEERKMDEEEGESREGQGRGKHCKYVFCVIGQTLPRSKSGQVSDLGQMEGIQTNDLNSGSSQYDCGQCGNGDTTQPPQNDLYPVLGDDDEYSINDNREAETKGGRDEYNVPREARTYADETSKTDVGYRVPSDYKTTENGDRVKSEEHPYAKIGPTNRDSQTERLLTEWRERNKEDKEQSEKGQEQRSSSPINPYGDAGAHGNSAPDLATSDGTAPVMMAPEEDAAIQIHMNEAWSVTEEAKRHSQPPHLKWAKNVVREILGLCEENNADDPNSGPQADREADERERGFGKEEQNDEKEAKRSTGEMPIYAQVQKQRTVDQSYGADLDEGQAEPLEVEELRDDEDARSNSWGEVDLRHVLDTVGRRKRSSKFFNAAQLYQQYSEAAQNIEILRQTSSDALSTCDEPQVHVPAHLPPVSPSSSPAPSPLPARRPLPPLPPVPHPHSLSHTGSISNSSASAKTLPLPAPPKAEGRPSSPRLSISLTQSATLWRDLPGVRSSQELEELTEDQRRLQEVRFEVVTSEASYCRSLDIVVDHFVKSKQLGALLTTQDRNWLFSRLADVRAISHSFLSKLEERVEVDIMHFAVCDIIARHCQRFKMVYVPYLTNQSYQDATYQRLMNENPGFRRIVEKLERSPVCQRLPLRSFLVLPFQRITRIKLLVQNIVKRTAPGTEEVVQAIKSLKLLEKLIQESNDSISQMKSIESLVSLSAKVDFECRTLPLISQSRRLVREGPVTELMDFSMKETERNIYIHLFNDYLLLSLHKEGGRFTVIDHAPVSQLRAENCRVKLHSLQKNLFRLHLLSKALLLRTDTQSDKLRWISAISRPHPELDFSAAQGNLLTSSTVCNVLCRTSANLGWMEMIFRGFYFPQMQCMRSFVSQQPDELSLEKADIILVHQQSSDGWVEGTRLSDRHRGWMPESHLETITNSRVRQRNLSDALKLTTATAAV